MGSKKWLTTVGLLCAATSGCAARTDASGAKKVEELESGGICVVADSVVEHSCGHATFGPFASVNAQAYPGFVFSDISAAHTNFTVTLPGNGNTHGGAVLYSPGADGRYAFFTTPGVSLQVVDADGNSQARLADAAVPNELCAQIEQVAIFELSSTQTYTVVFGPTASTSTQTMVEFIGEGTCETCAAVDLDASRSLFPASRQDGAAQLETPLAFEVPEQIAVLQGTARVGTTTLSFRNGGEPWVRCVYAASPSLNAFKLVACTGHLRAGDRAEADRFKLVVNPGSALFGPISVELELEDESCHANEEE
jgi:hypothetical protein